MEGFRHVRRRKVLLGIFAVDTNAMIFGMPRSLLPAFADKLGVGPGGLGLMYSAPFAGALVASLLSGWMNAIRRQGIAVCLAAAAWGVAIAAFGLAQALWVALLFAAAAGAADFVSAVLRSNILLSATPDSLRGRLSGIELAQVAGAPEIGNVEAGIVASIWSVRASIVSGGVLTVIGTGVCALAIPALVRYDARNPQRE
jgi:MFS family permease